MENSVEVKKRGRKPHLDKPTAICLTMPTSMYEATKVAAGDETVQEFLRKAVKTALEGSDKEFTVTVSAIVKAADDRQAIENVIAHGVPSFTDYDIVEVKERI